MFLEFCPGAIWYFPVGITSPIIGFTVAAILGQTLAICCLRWLSSGVSLCLIPCGAKSLNDLTLIQEDDCLGAVSSIFWVLSRLEMGLKEITLFLSKLFVLLLFDADGMFACRVLKSKQVSMFLMQTNEFIYRSLFHYCSLFHYRSHLCYCSLFRYCSLFYFCSLLAFASYFAFASFFAIAPFSVTKPHPTLNIKTIT